MNDPGQQARNDLPSKCGLLALLPKPKGTATAINPEQKLLTISKETVLSKAAKYGQIKKDEKQPPAAAYDYDDSDSDDDFGLGAQFQDKLKTLQNDEKDEEEEEEEDYLLEEGPSKMLMPIGNGHSNNSNQANGQQQIIVASRPLGIDFGSDSEEEMDEENEYGQRPHQPQSPLADPTPSTSIDFFGLNEQPAKRPKLDDKISDEPSVFIDEVAPGPARPSKTTVAMDGTGDAIPSGPSGAAPSSKLVAISDQEAGRLIYEKELAPYGVNPSVAQHEVGKIIDVSVDAALGPDIRANLLRNLNSKQMAQLAVGPLPKLKKNEADRLAKRKHQITHLAQVAVSREEQLQEKWADSKQNKKMSRQKYGF